MIYPFKKTIGKLFGFAEQEQIDDRQENTRRAIEPFATQKAYDYSFETIKRNPNEDPEKLVARIKYYSDFLYDSHIYSCVQSRKSAVLSMDWEISSGDSKTPEALFIEEIFNRLDIRKIISDILDAVLYGYKPMEVYWDIQSGYLIPRDIIGKPSWWFKFDGDSQMRFMTRNSYKGEIPPPMKIVMVQHNPTYDNPYGDSVLSKCYFPMVFKRGGMELWSRFIEKYGMPLMHATTDVSNDKAIQEIATALHQLQQDGIAVTGDGININGIDTSDTGSKDNYKEFIHFNNSEISKAILSQTLTTEQGENGAYAMSQTHLQVRNDVIISDSKLPEQAFNKIIEWIIDYNFGTGNYPKFVLYKDLQIDMELAKRDQLIFAGGYCKPTEQYLMKNYSFKEGDLEMIQSGQPAPAFAENEKLTSVILRAGQEKTKSNALDEMSKNIIDRVLSAIEKGQDYKEIKKDITELFPDIDTSKVEELFSKSVLIATANGYVNGAK